MNETAAKDSPASLEANALQESAMLARRFVALAFCRADLLFELDNNQIVKFVAGATPALFGKNTHEMNGLRFLDLIHEDDQSRIENLLSSADDKGRFDDVAVRLKTTKSGASQAIVAGYRVPDFDNNFFVVVKISPNQAVQAPATQPETPAPAPAPAPEPAQPELRRDEEAGVLDKKSYATAAAQRVKEVTAAGGKAKVTMVKLDNLEELRKDLSDQDQDKLMTTIGGILASESLGGDTAGRIDEENFSFAHGVDVDIDSVGEKIENAAKSIAPDSIGIGAMATSLDAEGNDLSEEQLAKAISYSMQNFSSGKGSGSSNISNVFETMMAETMKNVESFKRICATRAFDLVYMPICDLKSGSLHHYEALTRFRGTGEESPFKLITMAEEIGIISEFDLAVAQKAVNFVNKQAASGRGQAIAVNVSGHSIQDPSYVSELHGLLKRATNLSRMLMFEITESSEVEDLEAVNETIQGFRSKGFKFALDDFGAGAAGFDYLNTFDIDTVKFDGPVVKRAYATDKGKAFLASMASLCNETGVETIAEMVEDKELAEFLLSCGVHLGQGWYFGKPQSEADTFKR